MKPTYSIVPFSESSNFRPINIAAISSASPTLIHTSDSVNFDELWIHAYNYSNQDVSLTLMLGGNSSYQQMGIVIPSGRGLIPVLTGQTFSGSVNISAFASATNSVSVLGRVNRIIFI